jgi:multidrug efflux pump
VNPSGLFIRRPVATVLLTLAIALLGVAAYFVLPVASLPQVDFPTIQVRAQFAGASPNVMAATVATPLERELAQIADVTEMTSTSSSNGATGQTNITLQFGLDRDINGAARDVQAAINAALALLPANLNSRPSYNKANPADPPIMLLTLTSDTLTAPQVYDQASIVVMQALSQINGVGEVDIGGGASPAIRVEMNPYALNKYGIGLEDVGAALQSTNAFQPKGSYSDGARRLQIYTNDQATQVADYQNVVIAYRNGAPVRLKDVATVVNGPESVFNLGLANGKQAIVVRVTKSPGANIVATVDRIKAILPQLKADLPAAIDMKVQLDNTITIRASLAEVERTLLLSVVLVVVVVLLFLRNGRATLIPAVAVTTSLLGTLAIMFLFHYSLDNLSLMALTVATGFVVDDAIVVLENITRHVEDGMPRFEAALVGAREVGFTVMSMSISLIAVFIPILAMGGIVGRLFREFAVTLSASIFISLIVSLTATPMMAARLVDEPAHAGDPNARRRGPIRRGLAKASDGLEAGFDRLLKSYERSLAWALDNSLFVLIMLITTVCLTVYLYIAVPKGFFPEQDNGLLVGGVQVDQASSFALTANKFRRLQAIVMHDKAVASVTSFTQSAGGFMFVVLKPKAERPGVSAQQVIYRLTPRLRRIAGAQLFLQAAQDIRVGGRSANAEYQYTLTSDDLDALRIWSNKLLEELKKSPDLTQANTDQLSNALETYISVDHATASRLGLTAQQIDNTLYDAFGQKFASIIYNPENQYHVVMEIDQKYQGDPNALKEIYVTPASGSSGGALGGVSATATGTSAGGGGSSPSAAGVLSSSSTSTPAAATLSSSSGIMTAASTSAGSSSSSASAASTATAINGALQAAGGSGSEAGGAASISAASVANLTSAPTVTGTAASGSSGGAGGATTGATGSSLNIAEVGSTSNGGTSASSSNAGATQGGAGSLGGAGVQRSTTGGAVAASTGVAISTAPETMIPLSAISAWALQNTPLQVNHQGTSAAATLSFNLAPGKSLSDAQKAVAQAINAIHMPDTVVGSFQGTAKVFQQSLSNEPLLIAAALMAVYIVLGVLYESYIHPLTVLSTIPSAGVGAVLAMMLFGIDFSIISLIGVILLIGIVKKNAIMIIDFALVAEREQGLSSRDAIYQACVLRFRPILMTTCAAIMGAVPLALGLGEGGELRQPLGIAIIGGLIASQMLTLLTTPVVYLYLDRLHKRSATPRPLPRGLRGAGGPHPLPAE